MSRSIWFTAICAAIVALQTSPSAAGVTEQSQDAVAYQIDAKHSGAIEFPSGFSAPLRQLWTRELDALVSYPVIAQGLVFVTTGDDDELGVNLFALDGATGAVVWQTQVSGASRWAAAAYDNGRLFVVDFQGILSAYDAQSGSLAWRIALNVDVLAPPVAKDGKVYVWGTGVGGTVFAVNERNGVIAWTGATEYASNAAPTLSQDAVYFITSCHSYKFGRRSGALVWDMMGDCQGVNKTPLYAWNRLFVRGYNVGAILSSATGEPEGSFVSTVAPAAFKDASGHRRVVTLADGVLTCSDPTFTTVFWTFKHDRKLDTAPIVINGQVVEGSRSGAVYMFDGETGAVLWQTSGTGHILPPDEHNGSQPLTGLGAGDGILVVPANRKISAYAPQ